jgi:hypothetical protein
LSLTSGAKLQQAQGGHVAREDVVGQHGARDVVVRHGHRGRVVDDVAGGEGAAGEDAAAAHDAGLGHVQRALELLVVVVVGQGPCRQEQHVDYQHFFLAQVVLFGETKKLAFCNKMCRVEIRALQARVS